MEMYSAALSCESICEELVQEEHFISTACLSATVNVYI